jgi:uncharacterized tellurite resistance protein B-like protein
MTHSPGDDRRFHTEVLKLLLQVITSDEQVAPEEIEELCFLAERWKVPASEVSALIACLREHKPLPAPDLGLLRTRPQDVIQMARVVAASDHHVANEEVEMLLQIRALLGI